MSERLLGIVKWFNDQKGFGFIVRDDADQIEDDVFVHYSNIIAPVGVSRVTLQDGERVEFTLADGREGKGKQAVEVEII